MHQIVALPGKDTIQCLQLLLNKVKTQFFFVN